MSLSKLVLSQQLLSLISIDRLVRKCSSFSRSLWTLSLFFTQRIQKHTLASMNCGSVFITDCVQLVSVEVWLLFPLSTLILPSCTDSGPLVSTLANTVILLMNFVGVKMKYECCLFLTLLEKISFFIGILVHTNHVVFGKPLPYSHMPSSYFTAISLASVNAGFPSANFPSSLAG